MKITPSIRNNLCLTAHPRGCALLVQRQIEYVTEHLAGGRSPAAAKAAAVPGAPKLVLVIGCSMGYGLASRTAAAFGYGAATVGVSFEKPGTAKKPGSPGWYNNLAFHGEAKKAGVPSRTLNLDAFSWDTKRAAIEAIREIASEADIPAKVDLVVYSLASPVRTDPDTGTLYKSVIKPIGRAYSGRTMDFSTGKLYNAIIDPATEEEIVQTIKVMGGEDWEAWIDSLAEADVLAFNARTVAYTYIGSEITWPIYKDGTLGLAKRHLEVSAAKLNHRLKDIEGSAWVSVNKGLVTRASSVIPTLPLYISILYKVMKEKGIHEGCAEQIIRLYTQRLYTPEAATDASKVAVDEANRIRIDDWELRWDVQAAIKELLSRLTQDNMHILSDITGFLHEFAQVHGFDVEGLDYDQETDPSGI